MRKVSDYTKKLNRFGNSLSKMLEEDFPKNTEIAVKIENHMAAIQFQILGAFLEKGEPK